MWHDLGIAEQQKAKKGRDDCIQLFSIELTHIACTDNFFHNACNKIVFKMTYVST